MEVVRVAAEAKQAAAESRVKSFTTLELAMQGEVGQILRIVEHLACEVAARRQECARKVEDVLFEHDGLRAGID